MPHNLVKASDEPIDVLKWSGYSIEATERAKALAVVTDDDSAEAVEFIKRVKSFAKEAEEARKAMKSPFDQMAKRIDAAFKPISESLSDAEVVVKGKVTQFLNKKEAARQEFLRAQEEEIRRKAEEAADQAAFFGPASAAVVDIPAPIAVMEQTRVSTGLVTASQKSVWRFEVVDAAKVPTEYLMVNEKLIGEKVRGGMRSIPGVRIYEEKTISVR